MASALLLNKKMLLRSFKYLRFYLHSYQLIEFVFENYKKPRKSSGAIKALDPTVLVNLSKFWQIEDNPKSVIFKSPFL